MQADYFARFALAAGYPDHALVGGNGGNQQPCCFAVHRPIVVGTIDLMCSNTTIDLYLI